MSKHEIKKLWDMLDDFENTLWRLGFVGLDWPVIDMVEYCKKYGSYSDDR